MTRKKPIRILSIDPGTREIGVAVLEGRELIYYGVKTLREGKLPHRVLRQGVKIVEGLIDDYGPQILVLEKTFYPRSRRSSILHTFCERVKAVAKERGLKVKEFTPKLARGIVCGHKATKRECAKALADQYPELEGYLAKGQGYRERQRERYWMNMFDAVALGLACYRQDVDGKLAI